MAPDIPNPSEIIDAAREAITKGRQTATDAVMLPANLVENLLKLVQELNNEMVRAHAVLNRTDQLLNTLEPLTNTLNEIVPKLEQAAKLGDQIRLSIPDIDILGTKKK